MSNYNGHTGELSPTSTQTNHLDVQLVVPFLNVTNNAFKSLGLTAIPSGEGRDGQEVRQDFPYAKIMLQKNGLPNDNYTYHHYAALFKQMPDEFVQKGLNDEGMPTFSRMHLGDIAAALGGHFMDLSLEHDVSTQILLGERSVARTIAGVEYVSAFEARLVILHNLYTMARGEWLDHGELYEAGEKYGIISRTAAKHIRQLRNASFIETRTRGRVGAKGKVYESQLVDSGEFSDSIEIIEKLLIIIAKFAIQDPEFLEQGKLRGIEIVNDGVAVPKLIEQSNRDSRHYGKHSRKTKKHGF